MCGLTFIIFIYTYGPIQKCNSEVESGEAPPLCPVRRFGVWSTLHCESLGYLPEGYQQTRPNHHQPQQYGLTKPHIVGGVALQIFLICPRIGLSKKLQQSLVKESSSWQKKGML